MNFVARGRLIVFGGCGAKVFQDLHVLELSQLTWMKIETQGEAPIGRAYHVR